MSFPHRVAERSLRDRVKSSISISRRSRRKCLGRGKSWHLCLDCIFRFRRCVVQSTLGMAPLNLCFNILFYVFLLCTIYIRQKNFWTLGTTALTCFRTLYPQIQRGHWRYFGTPRLTKAASIIPGGEGNTAGDALEFVTD